MALFLRYSERKRNSNKNFIIITGKCILKFYINYMTKETKGVITRGGAPLTLLGEQAIVGMVAPDFTVVDASFAPVKLSDFKGKTVVISVFPSIDTAVCATQTREFNKRAASLGDDVVVIGVSKDLPFALGRFCGAEGIKSVKTLSDFMSNDFGLKYGFLIKEMMLLGRGVVIVDKCGKIAYVEYVDDIAKEPDYDKALNSIAHRCVANL